MSEVTVSAVIVTYNRLPLLKKAIQKVLNQRTQALKHLIIVNGASSDGTREYLDSLSDRRLIVVHLSENVGGAGGFNQGMRQFYEKTSDEFVWVMDDDSMPSENALGKLLSMFEANPSAGWGASKVTWVDGNFAKMNIPGTMTGHRDRIYSGTENWVQIKNATFVSTIFKRELIKQIGLPQKEYFIWGDDMEFTQRASQQMSGYYVQDSIVVHESQFNAKPGDIVGEKLDARLPRYLYEYRNRILTSRRRHKRSKMLKTLVHSALDLLRTLLSPGVSYRGRKLLIIIKGTYRGLKFNPQIEYLS